MTTVLLPAKKERNPTRTREQILAAAARLFADRGFEATSLSDVGKAAGVSRATPGYFFGSKAELHQAVLERCFEEVRDAVRLGRERARRSGQGPEVILAGIVSDYFDFIAARPSFVKLMQREALSGRALEVVSPEFALDREMTGALAQALELQATDQAEIAHLLFSLLALTWFPEVHGNSLGRVIGVDPSQPGFLEARKRHVTELLLGWLRSHRAAAPARSATAPHSGRTP